MAGTGLRGKRLLFATEYLVDQNATAAAKRAGYSARSAHAQGHRLLKDAAVAAWVAERLQTRIKKLELKAERLDQELARCALVDAGDLFDDAGRLLAPKELAEDVRRVVRSVKVQELYAGRGSEKEEVGRLVEVKLEPKVDSLRLAYQRLGLLIEKHQLETPRPVRILFKGFGKAAAT